MYPPLLYAIASSPNATLNDPSVFLWSAPEPIQVFWRPDHEAVQSTVEGRVCQEASPVLSETRTFPFAGDPPPMVT